MRDRLFGYLLGALDPHEHEEVERLLSSDSRMCEELELMRKALAPLECDKGLHEPPIGLAETTCQRVASLRVERVHPADHRAAVAAEGGRPRRTLFGWSLVDLAVAAGILIAGGMLFFPAVNQSRFNAQVTRCKDNLARIGQALTVYSSNNADTYPVIPVKGNLRGAGMYAPQLNAKKLIPEEDKDRIFHCPRGDRERPDVAPIPSIEVLNKATPEEAKKLLPLAGGSYGYTLGYKDEQGYHPTKRLGRTNFPIMSDAPCPKLGYQQSSNHGGYGQNVLYDDGHVRYTTTSHQIDGSTDPDFFHNDAGEVFAGNHANDAVIGCSAAPPVRESDGE